MLADEHTGNLDQATGAAILGLLEELHAEGLGIAIGMAAIVAVLGLSASSAA